MVKFDDAVWLLKFEECLLLTVVVWKCIGSHGFATITI